jgi:alkylation response protein AidB-like acyl-CoA dehydrogenase/putative sterol carrier protein
MSSYYFSEEHDLFRQGLRDFLQKEVIPFIDEWEENEQIPKTLWKKFGDMGYLGLNYPESFGGADADFFYSVVFLEEIARCFSGGFTITPSVQQYMASPYIFKHGSGFLKDKYLRKAISGEWVCSIAITEPGAGSDAANIQTKAERQGDYFVVNGSKTFITNAYYGAFIITAVKTDPKAGINGVSLLIIDRNAAGLTARKLKKLGWHASDTAELGFDEVKVPVENLIGEEGQGFFYLMGGLQLERLAGALSAIAGCEHALEYTLQYANEREAFGRKINKFQVLRHRIAQMAAEIEATKYFIYHCCRLHADGVYAVKESSMAKLLATELSDKVMYQCLQFFGGYGYMEEFKIARMFRDSRVGTIGGGTSEIMREIIAKMVIDDKTYASSKMYSSNLTVPGNANGHDNADIPKLQTITDMSFETMLNAIKERASTASTLGSKLKFDFGDQKILLDGSGDKNVVSTDDAEADCTVSVKLEDLEAMMKGDLNPMMAFMGGKIKVKGDMGVAMKLQSFIK